MRSRVIASCMLTLALLAAACGGDDSAEPEPASGAPEPETTAAPEPEATAAAEPDEPEPAEEASTTLRLAFPTDMDPPDPDTNYQLHGNQVTEALYEGLLRYSSDNTNEIVGLLAESWKVADDGMTYTFTLREGLTFADGSPLDSETLKFGFERRFAEAVFAPSGYMLLPVDRYETPDPRTFIIHMAYPESAFLTYLASPFSPKAVNPALVAANEAEGDWAVEWMKTNSAGSGPYVIEEFALGQRYVLARNENYWGDAPFYERIEIRIIPDAVTQVLQLEGGDLDIITAQPIATVRTFEDREGFQVVGFPMLQKAWIHLNPHVAPTDDPDFRIALRAAIDRPRLVEQIWGEYAEESSQLYPVTSIDENLGLDNWEHDPSLLEAISEGKSVTLAYPADRVADAQAAEALQAQWAAAGLDVELVPTPDADLGSWQGNETNAPNMYYEVSFPDSTHPDTWARLFWYYDWESFFGGFLNYFVAGSPASDDAMNTGLGAVDQATQDESYDFSAAEITDTAHYITISDPQDVFIARDGITGFAHWLATPLTLDLAALRPG